MKTTARRQPAHWHNAMFCIALVLPTTALPAQAQEINSRAGVYYGAQITYATPYNSNKLKVNAAGAAIYAEKIWASNNAIRGRLVHVASKSFLVYEYPGNPMYPVAINEKIKYTGVVVDYLRYFDHKFLPYVFVGSGIFHRDYQTSKADIDWGGFDDSFKNGSAALYYGAGWDYVTRGGLRGAIEFSVRNGSETGQTFEASLSFGFRRGLFSGGRGAK
jgi:hypothetical protein